MLIFLFKIETVSAHCGDLGTSTDVAKKVEKHWIVDFVCTLLFTIQTVRLLHLKVCTQRTSG